MIICGVEEAGRGPVIGPMVMAGVTIDEKDSDKLTSMGVKDSKLILPAKREKLYDLVLEAVISYKIIILQAHEVDAALLDPDMNLNWLEAHTSAKIIDELECDKAILDCPSNNELAYKQYVEKLLSRKIEIVAEHKADLNYPVVSAASILAKVTRDREIMKLKQKVGEDFGSGYPSDPKTVSFLKGNFRRYDIFRKTWSSYKRLLDQESGLGRFLK